MPITPEQRELRKGFIGSSDMPAIMGLSPYANAADVYWQKVGGAESKGNEATEAGTELEPNVVAWAENELGWHIHRDRFASREFFCANHDGLIESVDGGKFDQGVEAKTCAVVGPSPERDAFGEPGTDEVPERVIIQCQHQMMVSDLSMVWVPVLIGGRGFVMFKVQRSETIIGVIRDVGRKFWEENVVNRVPPENVTPSLEIIRRIRRTPKKLIQLPASVVERWEDAKRLAKEAGDYKEAQEAALLATLGDAEAGECELGRVTFYEQKRKAYSVKESVSRVLRIVKPKEVKCLPQQ